MRTMIANLAKVTLDHLMNGIYTVYSLSDEIFARAITKFETSERVRLTLIIHLDFKLRYLFWMCNRLPIYVRGFIINQYIKQVHILPLVAMGRVSSASEAQIPRNAIPTGSINKTIPPRVRDVSSYSLHFSFFVT